MASAYSAGGRLQVFGLAGFAVIGLWRKAEDARDEILKIPQIRQILILTKARGHPPFWIPAFAGMTGD